jgi:hypothetical protein
MNDGEIQARVGLSGTIQYRDKDGNVIKEVQVTGSLPVEMDDEKGACDGLDDGSK